MLFGDLFQLPPIVDRELARYCDELYDSPYFFDAEVFKETQFYRFTLTKNYRQRDPKFTALLKSGSYCKFTR